MEVERTVLVGHRIEGGVAKLGTEPDQERIVEVVMLGLEEDVVQRFLRGDIEETGVPKVGILGNETYNFVRCMLRKDQRGE